MLKIDEYIDGLKLFRMSYQEGSFKSRGVEYLWDPSKIDVVTKEMEHGYMNFFLISNNQQNDYKKVPRVRLSLKEKWGIKAGSGTG